MKNINKILFYSLLCSLIFICGCGYLELSTDEEIILGEQVALEVESYYDLYRDPVECERLNMIASDLSRFTTRPFVYRVKIIDSDEINAFALPGGYIYVYRGLLDMGLNDDQLAAVIGHEVTHIEAMHIAELYERMKKRELFYTIAVLATGGAAYQPVRILSYLDAYLIEPKYSRDNEMECDLSSVQMMIQSGRNPYQFTELFKMWEKEKLGSNWIPSWMNSHPDFIDRIRYIEEEISLHSGLLMGKDSTIDYTHISYNPSYNSSIYSEEEEDFEEVNLKNSFSFHRDGEFLKITLTDKSGKEVERVECYGLNKKQKALSSGRTDEEPFSFILDKGQDIKYVIASIKYSDGEFLWDILKI